MFPAGWTRNKRGDVNRPAGLPVLVPAARGAPRVSITARPRTPGTRSPAGAARPGRTTPRPPGLPSPLGAGPPGAARLPARRRPDARLPRQRRSTVPRPRGRSVCHPPDARLPARGPCSRAGRGGGGRRSPPARRGPGSGAPQRRRHQVSGTASRRPGRSGAAPRLPELPPLSLPPSPFPIAARTEPKPGRKLPRWPQQWGEGGEAPPGPVRCAPRPDLTAPGAGPPRGRAACPGRGHGPRRSRRAATRAGGGEERSGTPPPASVRAPASRAAFTGGGRGLPDPGQAEAVCCHPPPARGGLRTRPAPAGKPPGRGAEEPAPQRGAGARAARPRGGCQRRRGATRVQGPAWPSFACR
ncbi:basic proline-rich protein-like [Caloenas nicobarica]|uniref:basic proline-rich protein-like n=1 Tax=Caloenas nicobarica TaxID=187106 RepID=UPI0032B7BC9B